MQNTKIAQLNCILFTAENMINNKILYFYTRH
jgi:hypothetical protein